MRGLSMCSSACILLFVASTLILAPNTDATGVRSAALSAGPVISARKMLQLPNLPGFPGGSFGPGGPGNTQGNDEQSATVSSLAPDNATDIAPPPPGQTGNIFGPLPGNVVGEPANFNSAAQQAPPQQPTDGTSGQGIEQSTAPSSPAPDNTDNPATPPPGQFSNVFGLPLAGSVGGEPANVNSAAQQGTPQQPIDVTSGQGIGQQSTAPSSPAPDYTNNTATAPPGQIGNLFGLPLPGSQAPEPADTNTAAQQGTQQQPADGTNGQQQSADGTSGQQQQQQQQNDQGTNATGTTDQQQQSEQDGSSDGNQQQQQGGGSGGLPLLGNVGGDISSIVTNAISSSQADTAASAITSAGSQGDSAAASAAADSLVQQSAQGRSGTIADAIVQAIATNTAATAAVLAQAASAARAQGNVDSFADSQAQAFVRARGAGRINAYTDTVAQTISQGGDDAAQAYGVAFAKAAAGSDEDQEALAEATATAFCDGGSKAQAFASGYAVALSRDERTGCLVLSRARAISVSRCNGGDVQVYAEAQAESRVVGYCKQRYPDLPGLENFSIGNGFNFGLGNLLSGLQLGK